MANGYQIPKAPAGSGQRFQHLTNVLSQRPGVRNPGALAAYIGRKKFGPKKFGQLGQMGKK